VAAITPRRLRPPYEDDPALSAQDAAALSNNAPVVTVALTTDVPRPWTRPGAYGAVPLEDGSEALVTEEMVGDALWTVLGQLRARKMFLRLALRILAFPPAPPLLAVTDLYDHFGDTVDEAVGLAWEQTRKACGLTEETAQCDETQAVAGTS